MRRMRHGKTLRNPYNIGLLSQHRDKSPAFMMVGSSVEYVIVRSITQYSRENNHQVAMTSLAFPSTRRLAASVAALAIVLNVAGCRSAGPPPTTEMTQARSAVSTAEDAQAMQYAALEYRRAQTKLQEAQEALTRGRHDQARRLAEQAAVDAELASVKARSARTQETVVELRESIRTLREEIERGN